MHYTKIPLHLALHEAKLLHEWVIFTLELAACTWNMQNTSSLELLGKNKIKLRKNIYWERRHFKKALVIFTCSVFHEKCWSLEKSGQQETTRHAPVQNAGRDIVIKNILEG